MQAIGVVRAPQCSAVSYPDDPVLGTGRIRWGRALCLACLSPALFVGRIEILSGGYTLAAPGIHNPVAQLDRFYSRTMSAAWV